MTSKRQVKKEMQRINSLFSSLKSLPQLVEFDDPNEEEAWRIADGIVDILSSSKTLDSLAKEIVASDSESRKLEILAEVGVELVHIKNHIEMMRSYKWT